MKGKDEILGLQMIFRLFFAGCLTMHLQSSSANLSIRQINFGPELFSFLNDNSYHSLKVRSDAFQIKKFKSFGHELIREL